MANLSSSSIYGSIDTEFASKKYSWNATCSNFTIDSTFKGIATFLGKNKNKDTTVAMKITDQYGKFTFAGFVQFHKSEEEGTDEGSWTLNFTFDEKDLDDKSWKIYDFNEDQLAFSAVADYAYEKHGLVFRFQPKDDKGNPCEGSPAELITIIFNIIKEYMRANVAIDPILEIDSCSTLTAAVADDNSVVVGFEPAPELKQMVKGDAEIK